MLPTQLLYGLLVLVVAPRSTPMLRKTRNKRQITSTIPYNTLASTWHRYVLGKSEAFPAPTAHEPLKQSEPPLSLPTYYLCGKPSTTYLVKTPDTWSQTYALLLLSESDGHPYLENATFLETPICPVLRVIIPNNT